MRNIVPYIRNILLYKSSFRSVPAKNKPYSRKNLVSENHIRGSQCNSHESCEKLFPIVADSADRSRSRERKQFNYLHKHRSAGSKQQAHNRKGSENLVSDPGGPRVRERLPYSWHIEFAPTARECTGILSQIRAKLRDWAVWLAQAGCYSQVALSSNDSR